MSTLSVLILAKDEEKNIADAIASVRFAGEVLVIDSGSTDRTAEIARSAGARVLSHPMGADGFAGQRNFAQEQASGDWVLYLDADERVLPELATAIQEHIAQGGKRAGRIRRKSVVMGSRMGYGVYAPDCVVRLFPRGSVTWQGVVHERPETDLFVQDLSGWCDHHCLKSWAQYFGKFDQYTTLMADRMHKNGRRVGFFAMYAHATYAFVHMYLFRLGFLDGRLGLTFCIYHYFYTLTKYVKLEELWKETSA
ncbi:glycosyltransferase family 2 protein [Selenomonas sp.]|uniref:glycosyltransferase family 2 protein n=1 Tax=Selenomonas sp. TaxID=2053611 RepID=UPI0025FD5A77|nr:glycosyltransferase family 2 protein [Selenomonas sp.]MCI6283026.1 glycosyltransferase family 2 protein [Selenomonas sp.]